MSSASAGAYVFGYAVGEMGKGKHMNDIGIHPSAVMQACDERLSTSWGRGAARGAVLTCLESIHKLGCFHGLRKLVDKFCHQDLEEIVPELSRTAVQGLTRHQPTTIRPRANRA